LVLMFVGKIRIKFIVAIIGFAFVGALTIYATAKFTPLGTKIIPRSATWVSRIDSYFIDAKGDEQSKDFQQTQALVAIQNGGMTGMGPGKSTQRNILPYSSSDFIYVQGYSNSIESGECIWKFARYRFNVLFGFSGLNKYASFS